MTTFLIIIITLAVLVVFHEIGHFVTAKCLGVGVKIFSLGFGPKLTSWTRGETEYRLSAIPFGGYVSFYEPLQEQEGAGESLIEKKDRSFDNASVLVRILIVAAGPAWNFLLAIVLCWGLFWANGLTVVAPVLGDVQAQSPAERAGFLVGDIITSINGVEKPYWDDVVRMVKSNHDRALSVEVLRDGQKLKLELVPDLRMEIGSMGTFEKVGFAGFAATGERQKLALGLGEAALHGIVFTWEMIAETAKAFKLLITGYLPSDAIGGPIMISQAISDHAERGLTTLLALIAVISVNLGLVNLLPLPVLDGGHILLFLIEAVRGRPVSAAVQKKMQTVGLVALLLLMAWGTYNDVLRL